MDDAKAEAKKVNAEAEGFRVEPVDFGKVGICLMLTTAIDFLKELGI